MRRRLASGRADFRNRSVPWQIPAFAAAAKAAPTAAGAGGRSWSTACSSSLVNSCCAAAMRRIASTAFAIHSG